MQVLSGRRAAQAGPTGLPYQAGVPHADGLQVTPRFVHFVANVSRGLGGLGTVRVGLGVSQLDPPTESPFMKKLILFLAALTTLAAHAADLRIEVTVPAQTQGAVLAALFDNSEGFPRGKPLQVATAQPGDGKAVVQFVGLPEGDYAVSVFLDENGNMKLDANVFGVPTELYGFSRNARSALGPPQFADAAFRVGADVSPQAIELK